MNNPGLVLDPQDFVKQLDRQDLVIVDMCKPEIYTQAHIPGAVHLDYADIVRNEKPLFGLIPHEDQLAKTLSKAGISPDSYVVAYDDEGGGKAARLLWTMILTGHKKLSLLDGGLHAWLHDQLPTTAEIRPVEVTEYPVSYVDMQWSADRQYILDHLDDNDVAILDTRTPEEFAGSDKRAKRAGHMPGAANFDWQLGMDRERGMRLHPAEDLLYALDKLDVTPDKEVIVHCHSHHRSALSFFMLRHIGFERVKGYPGSWSEWGNREDTPIEQQNQ
jgi:thiosulfate/3-mercaptopyruvate sulfurtransferase